MDSMFVTRYFEAQYLLIDSNLENARANLEYSLNELRVRRDDSTWQRMYINCALAYAQLLDQLGRYKDEGAIFKELLKYSPNEYFLGEYAIFLHRRKKDFNSAEKFYQKSLELYPNQASIHLKYASFLRYVRNDMVSAEIHYIDAVTSCSNSETLGCYASYLHSIRKIDEAEAMYKRAVVMDRTHVNNLCNYGLLLSEERGNYNVAEEYYNEALTMSNRKHVNSLYNYAVMLDTRLGRKQEAELLYRAAIVLDPTHAFSLYNLAVLLEDRLTIALTDKQLCSGKPELDQIEASIFSEQHQLLEGREAGAANRAMMEEVGKLYKLAMEMDPKDATIAADCGRFALCRQGEYELAQSALAQALAADPSSELSLYYMALLQHRQQRDSEAESTLTRLLERCPDHALGRLLMEKVSGPGLHDD